MRNMTKDREELIEIAANFYRDIKGRSNIPKVMDTVGFSQDAQNDKALLQCIQRRIKMLDEGDETKNSVALIVAPLVADVVVKGSISWRVSPHSAALSALTDPMDLSPVQVVLET